MQHYSKKNIKKVRHDVIGKIDKISLLTSFLNQNDIDDKKRDQLVDMLPNEITELKEEVKKILASWENE